MDVLLAVLAAWDLLWLEFWLALFALQRLHKTSNYPGVLTAMSPHYVWIYFNKNGMHGWISLGGTILAVTGLVH
ncbi:hypothetical protein O6H91_04G056700 [Diphasiastrum complanatum]|uniref:Uncharacterized protein n=1 Tax=Diphasiastrum complanatum TaxID=34168 RepID=A0ACC2DWX7_DIPCM|nr:hypothetical protein O6H91_04G056700 [Diphasiastrum complanatum]